MKNIKKYLKYAPIAGLILITLCVWVVPAIYKVDPNYTDKSSIAQAPSKSHPMGTDEVGRDILARLIYGGRVSIGVGIIASLLQLIIATFFGVVAGYFGKRIDEMILRLIDIFLCFPFYILALSLAAVMGPSTKNLILIIVFFSWAQNARIIRTRVYELKNEDFIRYYKIAGFSSVEIIMRHIIKNISETLAVCFTISSGRAILMEASLSFLGVGVQYPNPSWGNILSSAMNLTTIESQWWMWGFAAIAVVMTVLLIHEISNLLKGETHAGN